MAETLTPDQAPDTGEATPAPVPAQPSRLYGDALSWIRPVDTTRSDAALGERMRVGRESRDLIASSVARQRDDTEALDRTASMQSAEREAARPGALALPSAPSMAARGFADPGPNASLLQQLQSVMLGAGLMAQQIGGLRGSATAAVSALRGAFQGWAEGDRERANRSLTEWEANTKKLLQEHRARVDAYRDIVEDQKTSWAEKMAVLSMRSKSDEWAAMGKASEAADWDQVIKSYTHAETLGSQQQMQMVRTLLDVQNHRDAMAARDRAQAETERANKEREAAELRKEAEARRTHDETARRHNVQARNEAERLDLARKAGVRAGELMELKRPMYEMPAAAMKLAGQELALTNRLRQLDDVEKAITLLDKEGIIPKGPTWAESQAAQIRLNTAIKREDIAEAINTIKRQGTALVVGAEIALGSTASVMRLKSIAEAEAGKISETPKAYWDSFLPRLRQTFTEQLDMTRRHLGVYKNVGDATKSVQGGVNEFDQLVTDLGGSVR